MAKARRVMILVAVVALFAGGIYLGFKLSRLFGSQGPHRVYDTPVLLQQVQSLSELVTVKYVLQKIEVWDDPPPAILSLFAGDNRILLLAQGTVKAGIDLSQIKPADIKVRDKTISIRLPHARITDCYLNDNETKVVERTTGFLRSYDKDLEQKMRKMVLDDMRADALRGGIRTEADDRARRQLANLFTMMGFEKVEFILSGPGPGLETNPTRMEIDLTNRILDTTLPQNHSVP
ncbi:MAG TPA: DUF4230 domain-containing protein [Candidatus Polarisedimenticolia bacterium]|nr:DUF4230 domain-containing protein [Candidatus Polarisedimenticolia bacterium]